MGKEHSHTLLTIDYEIIAHNLFHQKKKKVTDSIMTYSLYTDPPPGRAGLTLKEAIKKGMKILEAKLPMSQVARAKEKGEIKRIIHIITDAGSSKIVRTAILGTGGDEIISSILHVMYADVTYQVIVDAVKPHPTVSELLPSLIKKLSPVN